MSPWALHRFTHAILQGAVFGYDVTLSADRPFVPQGEAGYSVKSETGQASHYYSQPFYTLTGTLTLPEGEVQVTGEAWLDREWSSQPLDAAQEGSPLRAVQAGRQSAPDAIPLQHRVRRQFGVIGWNA